MMIRTLPSFFYAGCAVGRSTRLLASSQSTRYDGQVCASLKMSASTDILVSRIPAPCPIIYARRCYFTVSRVCMNDASSTAGQQTVPQQTPIPSEASSASAASANGSESALDVAMRVNKMKKLHQSSGAGADKKSVEEEAWRALNSLTEDQINNAEGKAVSLLLNAWAYFAKYWAKGKDGPL